MEKLLLTEREVGDILSLGRSSVRKLMDTQRLLAVHVGRSLRFHADDVRRIADELRREGLEEAQGSKSA